MQELEKIDLIRDRLGVSYLEARDALAAAHGDVVEALVKLESSPKSWTEKLHDRTRLTDKIGEFIRKGNITKVKVKKEGHTVFEFPATLGALGVLGMVASSELALLAGLGTLTGMMKKYSLEVERTGEPLSKTLF